MAAVLRAKLLGNRHDKAERDRHARQKYIAKRWAEFGPKIIIVSNKIDREYRIYHAYTPADELRFFGRSVLDVAIRCHSGRNGEAVIATNEAVNYADVTSWRGGGHMGRFELWYDGSTNDSAWCVYVRPFMHVSPTTTILRDLACCFAACNPPYVGTDMEETITVLISAAVNAAITGNAANAVSEPREICAD